MKWKNQGHEFDDIGIGFQSVNEVIIYGAGEKGRKLENIFKKLDVQYVFADRRADMFMENSRVIAPEGIIEEMKRTKAIIVLALARENAAVVLKQLVLKGGLQLGKDIFEYDIFCDFYLHIFLAYRFKKCIIEDCSLMAGFKCSLKCKHCICAFPYDTNKADLPLDEVKDSADKLFHQVDLIKTFGIGCPDILLYKDLAEITEYIMEHYSSKIITFSYLVNGMVLPNAHIIDIIKKYDIEVAVSCYTNVSGWQEHYARFKALMEENNIPIINVTMDKWVDMGWSERNYHKSDVSIYDNCYVNCRAVYKNKLYSCIYAMTANRALYGYDDTEEAYDLEEDNGKVSLMEYLLGFNKSGELSLCHYCNGYVNINEKTVPVAIQLTTEEYLQIQGKR